MKNILTEDKEYNARITTHTDIEWIDKEAYVVISPPKEFDFKECMVYLGRSDIECLHRIKGEELYKLIKIDDKMILFKVTSDNREVRISFLNEVPDERIKAQVVRYVWDMFDLGTDLPEFYRAMKGDSILEKLTEKYYGLRVIKINDLFEALCWAIIGQQINLKFAYTLKKRLVEGYGEGIKYKGQEYWLFPDPEVIAELDVANLKELQFTTRKAEYIISLAKHMISGELAIEKLKALNGYEAIHKRLLVMRGIGNWTADYVIMKSFNLNQAFPISDVGLHNALKNILELDAKPSIEEIEKMAERWKGWESYATFYLWRSLYD
ncbi:DNA-3-methyladenine glycosylase [Wukongibacter baidiensis]|uniref:DNA-3-methyladenine glycosylase family protein n=1 Tax=Wukongibacter baidiensis TaxID=1723361 RepID=UPI003D7FD245